MSSPVDWESDVDDGSAAPQSAKDRLIKLINEAGDIEADLAEMDDEISLRKERLSEIKRVLLPNILDELGVSEIKLEDKTKIKVETGVQASVKKENEHAFYDWLVENKFGGLIKSNVTAEFERDDIELARNIVDQLRGQDVDATLKQSVHNATLKSFVKEQLIAGNTLPDTVTVFEFREAKIVLPKSKK